MKNVLHGLLLLCLLVLGLAFFACDDEPSDIGQACTRKSDCEKMCHATCDPSPCTHNATDFHGECSDTVQCNWELDSDGNLSPTVCP